MCSPTWDDVIVFNKRVKEESLIRNYKYVSMYDYLVYETTTKEIYFLDDIHINPKNVLYLFLKKMILNNLTE